MSAPLNLSAAQQLTTATYNQHGQPYPDQPERNEVVKPTEQAVKAADFLLHD